MLTPHPLPSPTLSPVDGFALGSEAMLVVGVGRPTGDGKVGELLPSAVALSGELKSSLAQCVAAAHLTGKFGEMEKVVVEVPGSDRSVVVLLVGLDSPAKRTRAKLFQIAAAAVRKLANAHHTKIVFGLAMDVPATLHDCIVAGALFACEGQDIYQREASTHVPSGIDFVGTTDPAVRRGETIGRSMNITRRLVNEPPSIMNPSAFADHATVMAGEVGLACEVWDERKLAAENCRAILAVGRGSASPPRLVILRHHGGGDEAPLAIVGKGVTFDSGGLSIKPSEGMVDMKCDMAGAATVVGVMHAIAAMGVRRNVIGVCGLAENMLSGDCYKLGDVIETRSGKTIEILNTDAEGRVVLADTLDVTKEQNPSGIVDLATLTGACMVALGNEVAGLMTNNELLLAKIREAADVEGEPVWPLPMFDLYDEKVKSKVADIKNVGEGRWGGAITAAKFLEHFVGDVPWCHIDIAGPAFADSVKPHRDAGATGVMVRTLIRWIETA